MSSVFNPADPHAALVRMGGRPGGDLYHAGDMSPSLPPFFFLQATAATSGASVWGRLLEGMLSFRSLTFEDIIDPLGERSSMWVSQPISAFGSSYHWRISYGLTEWDFPDVPPGFTIELPPRSWGFWLLSEDPSMTGVRVWYWTEAPTQPIDEAFLEAARFFHPARRNIIKQSVISPPRTRTDDMLTLGDLIVEGRWP